MKKLILFATFYLTGTHIQSQNFTSAFDPWDNANNNGNGEGYQSNAQENLTAVEPGLLQSYLDMFKATKDIHYLEKFAIQATRVMENRFLSPKRPNSHCHAELVSASQNKILAL